MADSGSVADTSVECVNLLYLASKQREKADGSKQLKTPDTSLSDPIGVSVGTMDFVPSDKSKNSTNLNSDGAPPINRLTKPASVSSMDREIERICPRVNCPEKIILCLDVSEEMEKVSFRSRAGDKFSPIKLVKRAVGIFLHSKHKLNPAHEFSLVVLRDQAYMMHDFTNNPDKVISILQELDNCFSVESCDLASLFDCVQQHTSLPKISEPTLIPPPYIVRTVLLYGRSHCIPHFSQKESLKMLRSSPHFFLDIFYIHETPSDDNDCEAVFDTFCELDEKGLSYIFEVSRNPTKLYDCMAQLLPHPLQRPIQNHAMYSIDNKTQS